MLSVRTAVAPALAPWMGPSPPLNIDGALAALISGVGFDWRLGKGFIIAREGDLKTED